MPDLFVFIICSFLVGFLRGEKMSLAVDRQNQEAKEQGASAIPSLGRGREGFIELCREPLPATTRPVAPLPWGGNLIGIIGLL